MWSKICAVELLSYLLATVNQLNSDAVKVHWLSALALFCPFKFRIFLVSQISGDSQKMPIAPLLGPLRVIMLFNRNLPTRCQKTSLRAFISWIACMALSMLCAYSIGAPIGAGQISRENHYHSFQNITWI